MAPTENSVCDEYCLNCKYFYGSSEYELCCTYYLETDKRRPCPAGTGCTVKKKSKQKRMCQKFQHERMNVKEQTKQGRVFRNCLLCGKEFLVTRHDKKYCDAVCCYIANNRKNCEKSKANRKPIYKHCKRCGKEFLLLKSAQLYCSEECKNENMMERKKLASSVEK